MQCAKRNLSILDSSKVTEPPQDSSSKGSEGQRHEGFAALGRTEAPPGFGDNAKDANKRMNARAPGVGGCLEALCRIMNATWTSRRNCNGSLASNGRYIGGRSRKRGSAECDSISCVYGDHKLNHKLQLIRDNFTPFMRLYPGCGCITQRRHFREIDRSLGPLCGFNRGFEILTAGFERDVEPRAKWRASLKTKVAGGLLIYPRSLIPAKEGRALTCFSAVNHAEQLPSVSRRGTAAQANRGSVKLNLED
ncbi:hypothetical protein KM043_005830 [Ampulex compressa]|nr:hypothetical protein KM043_005830 [Ampulex compressa]